MQIEILDSIECQVSKKDAATLFPILSFESSYWTQGPFKKQRKTYQKNVFSYKGQTHWRFYTGLLPRIRQWCIAQNIPLRIIGEELKIPRQNPPFLEGIEFRPDQLKMIDLACEHGRGVIHAPTGVGKTIMQLGLTSCYPNAKVLLLCHTVSIIDQTFKEFQRFGFKDVEMFGGGNIIQKPSKRITVSTMQSFVKLDPRNYMDYYDIVIVDEAHHTHLQDSTYTTILSHLLAPIRIGFTATVRTNIEAQLVSEGMFGPVIGKTTIEEAAELNILARPKLKFIKAQCSPKIMDIRKYQEVYEFGIVNNKLRNRQIAEIVSEFYHNDETTLIFVTHIAHGELIAEELHKLLGIEVPFVQGDMPQDERTKVKNGLLKKTIKICIATTSWGEGIDIKNLQNVVLAGGGKSEIQTLQKVGRGLRKTDGKEFVTIVDFLDLAHFHLVKHTGERLGTYSDMNWL
jgi:superfamily II DNA or RNA helicase